MHGLVVLDTVQSLLECRTAVQDSQDSVTVSLEVTRLVGSFCTSFTCTLLRFPAIIDGFNSTHI